MSNVTRAFVFETDRSEPAMVCHGKGIFVLNALCLKLSKSFLKADCAEYEVLADTDDVLAELGGSLLEDLGEHHHGGGGEALHQGRALGGVLGLGAEALALQDADALGDGGGVHHEVRHAGHDVGAVVAGPVAQDRPGGEARWDGVG